MLLRGGFSSTPMQDYSRTCVAAAAILLRAFAASLPFPRMLIRMGLRDRIPDDAEGSQGALLRFLLGRHDDTVGCCAAVQAFMDPGGYFQKGMTVYSEEGEQLRFPGLSAIFYAGLMERASVSSAEMRLMAGKFIRVSASVVLSGDAHMELEAQCSAAFAVSLFWQAESCLMAVLPHASQEADWTTWRTQIEDCDSLIRQAMGHIKEAKKAPDGCCFAEPDSPLQKVLVGIKRRVFRLAALIYKAFREPWLPRPGHLLRGWLREDWLLKRYQELGRPASLPIGSTSSRIGDEIAYVHRQGYQNKAGGLGSSALGSRKAFEEAWRALSMARRSVQEEFAEPARGRHSLGPLEGAWWPVKGTILLMLRHGSWHGQLAGGKVDIVDRDMDFSMAIGSAASWVRMSELVTADLVRRGWLGCEHHSINWYMDGRGPLGTAWNPAKAANGSRLVNLDGRGTILLVCMRLWKEYDSWSQLEIHWNVVAERADTSDSNVTDESGCEICAGREPTTDQGCENEDLGVELKPESLLSPWRPRQLLESAGVLKMAFPHLGLKDLVAVMAPVCTTGDARQRCFATGSYPYQCWDGALPVSCATPFTHCGAYNVSVPCSECSRTVLKYWNSGKYWARIPGRPCLALPLIWKIKGHKDLKDRMGYDERNQRLQDEGITEEDLAVLQHTSARLRERFDAFGASDYAECQLPGNGKSTAAVVTLTYNSV
eukprot:TRINITY_DN62851_c0_g1_i2.p1 TRINITY_DN62851_c0_g1~~TRINITY_DN62851_c0_g1_i2.p1  ORF type:complete len:713 (+),score=144.60 TRINITY_DN62851_c0_g1_i2:68-2206(+)